MTQTNMTTNNIDQNYLVTVLPDRIQAEDAYSALRRADISPDHISMLGRGYMSADEYGLIDPNQQADKNTRQLVWLIPFGFAAGFLFNWLTQIRILGISSPIANHILGGLIAAAAAAMGAYVVGRLVGWTVGSGDAIRYRNRLNAGKYLIIVEGPSALIDQATRVLNSYSPENIQGYTVNPS